MIIYLNIYKLFQKYILMTLITFSPAAVERNIHDKLREAALRRADREKELMERLHRQSLKRQTNNKLDHLLELFDMLQ